MNKDVSSHPGLTLYDFINWEMLTHFDLLLYPFSYESIDYLAQYLKVIHVLYVYAYINIYSYVFIVHVSYR